MLKENWKNDLGFSKDLLMLCSRLRSDSCIVTVTMQCKSQHATYCIADLGTSAVVRVIEQCCFNRVPDPFNGQTVNFISKPPKVIESRTYVKKSQSETLLKQHCSINLTTALVPKSAQNVT